MITENDLFVVGKMGAPHGLRGEIDCRYTDSVFMQEDDVWVFCKVDGLPVPFLLEDWRQTSDSAAILKFRDYDSADSVRMLTDSELLFPKDCDFLDNREITSWRMLTGFHVSDKHCGDIGVASGIDDSSANIIMYVRRNGGDEVVLPLHPDLISELDVHHRQIILDLPQGLLTLNDNSPSQNDNPSNE